MDNNGIKRKIAEGVPMTIAHLYKNGNVTSEESYNLENILSSNNFGLHKCAKLSFKLPVSVMNVKAKNKNSAEWVYLIKQ